MTQKIKFYLDTQGVKQAIYQNEPLAQLEKQAMEKQLSQVQAAFRNDFGFEGKFRVEFMYRPATAKRAPSGAVRPVYRLYADDARTTLALKKQPGWLARFSANAKL